MNEPLPSVRPVDQEGLFACLRILSGYLEEAVRSIDRLDLRQARRAMVGMSEQVLEWCDLVRVSLARSPGLPPDGPASYGAIQNARTTLHDLRDQVRGVVAMLNGGQVADAGVALATIEGQITDRTQDLLGRLSRAPVEVLEDQAIAEAERKNSRLRSATLEAPPGRSFVNPSELHSIQPTEVVRSLRSDDGDEVAIYHVPLSRDVYCPWPVALECFNFMWPVTPDGREWGLGYRNPLWNEARQVWVEQENEVTLSPDSVLCRAIGFRPPSPAGPVASWVFRRESDWRHLPHQHGAVAVGRRQDADRVNCAAGRKSQSPIRSS